MITVSTTIYNCGDCRYSAIKYSLNLKEEVRVECEKSNFDIVESIDKVKAWDMVKNMPIPENCPLRPKSVRMSQEEFENIAEWIKEYNEKYSQQREGQAMFNMLFEKFPAIAETIRGTTFDPFYCDEKIQICYEFIYSMFVK